MKFLTEVEIKHLEKKIEHSDTILTIGSCFAENVGELFKKFKFNSLINPFGVLYNTASIKNSLDIIAKQKVFTEDDLIFDQSEWHSFYHHSNFSHHKVESILSKINSVSASTFEFLKNVDWIIISLGTSFVFYHRDREMIVSNCHKIPQKEFEHKFLSVSENTDYLQQILKIQKNINPGTKFIFTVSPVRHLRDGAHENTLSKSSLQLAVEDIVRDYEDTYYFPSYEIMMDELRDYRFFDKDLLHPNQQAVDYIWEKFSRYCLSESCSEMNKKISKIISAAQHRIRNTNSTKSQEFVKSQIDAINKIIQDHPHINFNDELEKFQSYLKENQKD